MSNFSNKERIDGQLAIEGGEPIRSKPIPEESPGIHYMGDKEIEYVTRVVKARSPFRFYGPDVQHMCDRLEARFREIYGVDHALGVSSGTQAIYISLAAMGVGPGDEVLIPGYLWPSCLNGVVRLGAIPRLVDIDETFTMSAQDLQKKITPNSKAVVLIHMSGVPGNLESVVEVARKSNLYILEDCAQCNGSTFHGKPVGTFGDIGIFSFQINKSVTAGEGGMIICSDDHLFNRCFGIHDLGYARNNTGILMDTSCEERYHLWGCGARMSELTGALALAQVEKLKQINSAMRSAKYRIRKDVDQIPGIVLRTIPDPAGDTGAFLITIYEDGKTCRQFTEALKAEGMTGRGYAKPCITMEEWGLHWYFNNKSLINKKSLHANGWPWSLSENQFASAYKYARGTLPVCDDLASRSGLFKIPSCLTDDDIEDIILSFKKVAHHVLR
jgi:dTDP-4-amino-4,6-dideoxygalactose transaminase